MPGPGIGSQEKLVCICIWCFAETDIYWLLGEAQPTPNCDMLKQIQNLQKDQASNWLGTDRVNAQRRIFSEGQSYECYKWNIVSDLLRVSFFSLLDTQVSGLIIHMAFFGYTHPKIITYTEVGILQCPGSLMHLEGNVDAQVNHLFWLQSEYMLLCLPPPTRWVARPLSWEAGCPGSYLSKNRFELRSR